MENTVPKRNIAYKLRIGNILLGKPVIETDRFKHLDLNDKQIIRINLVANVIEKYLQEGEKKYASITLDDGTGQIRVKTFGEDTEKFSLLNQGDTLLIIGLLRSWNNELYITPEIIKKKDPLYLLVRKYEVESEQSKHQSKDFSFALKEKIIQRLKDAEKDGGLDIESLILELHEPTEHINGEIKKLIQDGNAFEPRPGKLRWLG